MITITHPIAGREAVIRVIENGDDILDFSNWLNRHEGAPMAIDTETTGLDIFSDGFRVRTVQFGIGLEAWVYLVNPDSRDSSFLDATLGGRDIYLQNAAFDVLAIKQYFGYQLDWDRITDTQILAHLIDSRAFREGGTGHSLQDLTAAYLDPVVAAEVKMLASNEAKRLKMKKDEYFANVPIKDHNYLLYAGMDVVLTYGLHNILKPLVPESARGLIRYEHKLAEICSQIEEKGFLLDQEYTQQMSDYLTEEEEVWKSKALIEYGTESVHASAQVAEDLIASGVKLTKLTDTGRYQLDEEVLKPLADQGVPLAMYVMEAKKISKQRSSWVDKFLAGVDSSGRCHANINPLKARTARMSITGIPAQTLPASDWKIRRCFLSDPGEVIVSCDYQAQELRVLSALSGDKVMQQAFIDGADLHQITADASGVSRKIGKTVNFQYVYGSGPSGIAESCGITFLEARKVIKGFEKAYPKVKEYSDFLQREAKARGYITTPFGRRLYVDKDRAYAALNYMIQSTSRDITSRALIRLHEAGFTPYVRLPIHDEILACIPKEHADWGSKKIAEIMAEEFYGVMIASDADIYGQSWGGGYIGDDDPAVAAAKKAAYEATFK